MPDHGLLPLEKIDHALLAKVRFILTDVDDTLTWQSTLPVPTYSALYDLTQAGYIVIPVTGGCAGWSDLIARLWPVAGVITESGACFIQKQVDGLLQYRFWSTEQEMKTNKEQLLAQVEPLLVEFSPLKLARDQSYRLTDVAVDYGQDINPPANEAKQAFLEKLCQLGLQAKASSIHINIWQGDYDKYAMAARVLQQQYGLSEQQMEQQVLYVGDAPNDESMFARFPLSVGVANIKEHLAKIKSLPKAITTQQGGFGFREIADKLLSLK